MKNYISTRNGQKPIGFYEAIVQGIGDDGGLLVPDFDLPKLDLASLLPLDYISLATEILSVFTPTEDKDLIRETCAKAYGLPFPQEVVPIKKAGDCWIAELFHGKTAAFKDMALSLLPHLMTLSMKQIGEDRKVMILVATSGDTGKAALEGFKDVEGTEMLVFYPTDGVSDIQKQQMISQEGENLSVVGIRGNFDDAQRAVKEAFSNKEILSECRENKKFLSSANSINIGRLIPQIIYYIWSYLELVRREEIKIGDKVNFCVPSGNFGNCLAGWLAKHMGVPVNRFLVASNKNNILTDFFNSGRYDTNREFHKTISPAMDILISSNLERLLWFVSNKNGEKVADFMHMLKKDGVYELDQDLLSALKNDFSAGWLDEAQILETIRQCYNDTSYLLDTHTACGYGYYKKYAELSHDESKCIIMATASPYKFPDSVLYALSNDETDSRESMDKLEQFSAVTIPEPLKGIWERPVRHQRIIDKAEIAETIKSSVRKNR